MKKQILTWSFVLLGTVFLVRPAGAADKPELSTPPASESEKEAAYSTSINSRATDILKPLAVTDVNKSNTVHDVIVAHYRSLRARDALIDAKLKTDGKEVNYANRAAELATASKPLHEKFLAALTESLTPEQVEMVKDGMTYKKVKVTFDAYCAIVPNLTDTDKAKITELLKLAREEAMDGGNAPEKSEIFQKYKNQINAYLDAHDHDTAKAFKDWETRQAAVAPKPGEPTK